MLSREWWGPAAQVDFKECIVVNWVTPLSLTFNLVTWPFSLKLSHVYLSEDLPSVLFLGGLQSDYTRFFTNEQMERICFYCSRCRMKPHSAHIHTQDWMQPGIMNLQKHLLVQGAVISGSLSVPQDRTECHPSGVEQMCRVSPGV